MIKSPCINKCKLENNICLGCKRTIREITEWRYLNDDQKLLILKRLEGSLWANINHTDTK